MTKPKLTLPRIIAALCFAMLADLIQVPITAAFATGVLAIPAEILNFLLDCGLMVITCLLLRFHWLLLPSLFAELIPGVAAIPTWTGCVILVILLRKREEGSLALPEGIAPHEAQIISTSPTPSPLPSRSAAEPEQRLKRLSELLAKSLISEAEFNTKRHEILAEV